MSSTALTAAELKQLSELVGVDIEQTWKYYRRRRWR